MKTLLPGFLATFLLFMRISNAAESAFGAEDFRADFDKAIREIGDTYAYFDRKATQWGDVSAKYASDLQRVRTEREFITLMEHVIDELYDPHAQLNINTANSPRLVPSGADLWAEWRGDDALITQVRPGSDAARAGISPGDAVLEIEGKPAKDAIETRLGRTYPHATASARDWALRAVLAGRHNSVRVLKIRHGGDERLISLPADDQFRKRADALLSHSEPRAGVGYVRFNDSLGNNDTIASFDKALEELRGTRALIVDLRDTPSGGNSVVARGILGRFVASEKAYQKHELPSEERESGIHRSWLELVSPRGGFQYRGSVVVLVSRWTGSMGEGLALGFDAAAGATVIGTPMAGLMGATYTIALPRTGFSLNVPAERLYHVNGTPRERYSPKIVVAMSGSGDSILDAALKFLGADSKTVR